ncbi:hypothetical protein P7K49_034572 [Saguinus oedipus]|uniref:Uncharacterized protein n=1 Tax=Saguinus oedipus TaxID=9490 RepID=A0ABQ9TVY8_SAGOE|nr:hypothetical protein P7K49_034572 [Saguinus oedipus]
MPWLPGLRAVLRLGSEVAAALSSSQLCPLALPPPRTEPAAGKETGAAKVSKNLELARLIPVSSSAQELGPPKLTPQEKLKLRMQKALNRQFKADKKAAQEKMIQQEHERQEREDELRAMARKIRMK